MNHLEKSKKPDSITVIASINMVLGISLLVFSFIFKNINKIFFEANELSFNELLFSVFPVLNIYVNNQDIIFITFMLLAFVHSFGGIFFMNGSNFGRKILFYLNWLEYLIVAIIATLIIKTTNTPFLDENDKIYEYLMNFYKSYFITFSVLLMAAFLVILYFTDKKNVKEYCTREN